jgi:hypothetical protein
VKEVIDVGPDGNHKENSVIKQSSPNHSNLFDLQEKAISDKELTQKCLIHKMFKNKNLSPSTYQAKKRSLEVWVSNEREKLQKQKKDFKNVYQNTLEMINSTNQTKSRIKSILNKSCSKRPGIWSDYNDSLRSSSLRPSVTPNLSLQLSSFTTIKNDLSITSLISKSKHSKSSKTSIKQKLKKY